MRRDWTPNAVGVTFKQVFGRDKDAYGPRDFQVNVTICEPKRIEVVVKQMYEYVEVTTEKLFQLANLFDTTQINVDEWSSAGCETCDWGSSYEKSFLITPEVE